MVEQATSTPFADVYTEATGGGYTVIVGQDFHGYIRQIRITQDWEVDSKFNTLDDDVQSAGCAGNGTDAFGAATSCTICSKIALDTSNHTTCYVDDCTDDSYS